MSYNDEARFREMADEANRSRRVWMDEYLRVNDFCGALQKAFNALEDAAIRVRRRLDVQSGPAVALQSCEALSEAVKKAKTIMVDAVQPLPTPDDPLRTFKFLIERDHQMSIVQKSNGDFADVRVQQLWSFYQAGAKFGFRNREKKDVRE